MSFTDQSDTETKVAPQSVADDSTGLDFWCSAWFGTGFACGAVGLFMGGIEELFVLATIAGIWGIPVVFTFGLLSWAFWLTRFSIPMAVVSGACTGVLSTTPLVGEPTSSLAVWPAVIIGAVGAGISTSIYVLRHKGSKFSMNYRRQPWRYSLRDLFIRFTVVTLLIAGWTAAVKAIGPW